jgi:hypothetical protein
MGFIIGQNGVTGRTGFGCGSDAVKDECTMNAVHEVDGMFESHFRAATHSLMSKVRRGH